MPERTQKMNVLFDRYVLNKNNYGVYDGKPYLNLCNTGLTIEDLKHTVMPFLTEHKIKILNLSFNSQLGNEGCGLLSRMQDIEELNISCCNVSDEGAAHLAKMRNLKKLACCHNRITVRGAKVIASMENLEELLIKQNNHGTSHYYTICGPLGDAALIERNPLKRTNDAITSGLKKNAPTLKRIGMYAVKLLVEKNKISQTDLQKLPEELQSKINFDIKNTGISKRPRI